MLNKVAKKWDYLLDRDCALRGYSITREDGEYVALHFPRNKDGFEEVYDLLIPDRLLLYLDEVLIPIYRERKKHDKI